jgi:hypothetical protein
MKTLNLKEAAELLHIHPITLQKRAAAGEIPGSKIGRAWVFVDVDLIDYIRSQYTSTRQDAGREDAKCFSIERVVPFGTTNLQSSEKRYNELLERKTKRKPKK